MTTTLSTLPGPTGTLTGRALISPTLFDRLVLRIVIDDNLGQDLAERIVDQALAFLAACARTTSTPLAPSKLVDIGWHTFLLHTRDYAKFCDDVAGRFLHHVPVEPDETEGSPPGRAHETLRRTIAAIEDAGFTVDLDLWPHANAADCTGCHHDPPPAR